MRFKHPILFLFKLKEFLIFSIYDNTSHIFRDFYNFRLSSKLPVLAHIAVNFFLTRINMSEGLTIRVQHVELCT